MDSQPEKPEDTNPSKEPHDELDEARAAQSGAGVRSLRDLLDRVTGRDFKMPRQAEESGLAEILPYPFLALVGQQEMKLALLLALINPAIGGVILIGPRGTGKTTAVRGLIDLLPDIPRSLCYYGCLPEDIETGGIDAVCPECAKKYAQGEPLVTMDRVRLVELPLNARLEDVIGGLDERAAVHERVRLRRGILAQADRNLLFVDEINLLENDVIDALLDAAAQGRYSVRRGPLAATYWSRITLVGSMNPEEGTLRPQIQDRLGLRVIVRGLAETSERLEAYRRVQAYMTNPRQTIQQYQIETAAAQIEIQSARDILPQVQVPDDVATTGLRLVKELKIDSLRAEITLFEAARAYTAADNRTIVTLPDIREVAPLALRLRRSEFMVHYFDKRQEEEGLLKRSLDTILGDIDTPTVDEP